MLPETQLQSSGSAWQGLFLAGDNSVRGAGAVGSSSWGHLPCVCWLRVLSCLNPSAPPPLVTVGRGEEPERCAPTIPCVPVQVQHRSLARARHTVTPGEAGRTVGPEEGESHDAANHVLPLQVLPKIRLRALQTN